MADELDDLLVEFLGGETATNSTSATVDFRVEINCQKGHHYMRTRRGSGSGRRKEKGTEGKETYQYDGEAQLVADERKGYYEFRWTEYQANHQCHYKKLQADTPAPVGDPGLEDGIRSLA